MTKSKQVAEAAIPYQSAVTTDLAVPLVIERDGDPFAVLIPYGEYQRLRVIEATTAQHQAQAWHELETLLDTVHSRPTVLTSDQIESEITATQEEVRAQYRAHHRSH